MFYPLLIDHLLIFGGSLLLFPDKDGHDAYKVLANFATDYRQSKYHFGHNTSFLGYDNDPHKVKIYQEGFSESRNTDLIFQRGFICKQSFSFSGEFDPKTFKLVEPLNSPIQNEKSRYFTSDRCFIGCDLTINKSTQMVPSIQALNHDYFFNFTPRHHDQSIRVVNWNIKTSFHDEIISKDNHLRKWETRFVFVKEICIRVQSDIMLLQEMSPNQAKEVKDFLLDLSFDFVCRCAHSGHDLEEIQQNEWTGAIMGIAFSKKRFKLLQSGGFWLKDDPNIPPSFNIPDSLENRKPIKEGGTNKCFGDTHSYRSCLWVHLVDISNGKKILVCVSDFPHQSESGAQLECAKLVTSFIDDFSADYKIFGGEVCTFADEVGKHTMSVLLKSMTHWMTTKNGHYGHQTTFVGYPNDKYLVPISKMGIIQPRNIDILLHNGFHQGSKSFSFLGEFYSDLKLSGLNRPVKNVGERLFASDHLLIGVDLIY